MQLQKIAIKALQELPQYSEQILTPSGETPLEQVAEILFRIHAVYFSYLSAAYELVAEKTDMEEATKMIRGVDQTTLEGMLYILFQGQPEKLDRLEKLTGRDYSSVKALIGISKSEEKTSTQEDK